MKRKLVTRAVSLFLSAIMLFSVAVPVFAIEPPENVPIIIGGDSSQTEKEYNLDGNGSNPAVDSSMDLEGKEFNVIPFPWKNIMEDKDGNIIPSARATQSIIECNWMKYINPKLASQGEIPWLLVTIGGDVAYCVDTLNHSSSGGTTFVEKTDYTKLSAGQKDTIAYIMRYGAKTTAQDTNNILLHMATQTLIWEVIDGERATYTLSGNSGGVYKDLVKRYPAIADKYNSIIQNAKSWSEIPSFAKRSLSLSPTHKLEGTGPYTTSLENTNANCDLSQFKFNFNGITSNVSGTMLNLSSNAEITTPMTVKTERKDATPGDTFIFWFDPSGKDQTRTRPGIDPVPAYFKLSTEESTEPEPPTEDEEYEIIINKYEKGTNIPLAGAQFAIKYLGGSGDSETIPPEEKSVLSEQHFETSVTTDESGSATVTVPYKGVYEIRETAPPANHKLDENFLQTVIVNEDVPTASVDFHNEPYTGVSIQKIDAQTRAPLQGLQIRKVDDVTGSPLGGVQFSYYFSDESIMEYYKLCRKYSKQKGIPLKENPFMQRAEQEVRECLSSGCYYCYYVLKTKINHKWASGIVFYYDSNFFEFDALLERMINLIDFFRCEVHTLRAECEPAKIIALPTAEKRAA